MKYILDNLSISSHLSIAKLVKTICKENNINYEKQEYKVLFCNEKIFYQNNEIKFTSGFNKSLSFYGKIYSNKKNKIVENICLKDETITLEPNSNDLLIVCGGVDHSTIVENDEELLHFYVAPSIFLGLQDPELWQVL